MRRQRTTSRTPARRSTPMVHRCTGNWHSIPCAPGRTTAREDAEVAQQYARVVTRSRPLPPLDLTERLRPASVAMPTSGFSSEATGRWRITSLPAVCRSRPHSSAKKASESRLHNGVRCTDLGRSEVILTKNDFLQDGTASVTRSPYCINSGHASGGVQPGWKVSWPAVSGRAATDRSRMSFSQRIFS
jgi:hypothetical protein